MRVVAAAVIIEDGRLFLARRPPGDNLAGMWELPGGKVEVGETPQECLARELREELAMEAKAGEILAETEYTYVHGRFRMLALRAVRQSGFELLVHDRVAWVSADGLGAHDLAPADVALVRQLVAQGDWPPLYPG